jgi:hypothetical protein
MAVFSYEQSNLGFKKYALMVTSLPLSLFNEPKLQICGRLCPKECVEMDKEGFEMDSRV